MGDASQGRGIADRILAAYSKILSLTPEEIDSIGKTTPIPCFEENLLLDLCSRARELFKGQEMVLEVPPPTYIIGDLHGNIFDCIRVLIMSGPPPTNRFIFLGDYVDRGEYSIEVVTLLFALAIKYPENVFLLRGNHEFSRVNANYGFQAECQSYYGSDHLYESFNSTFEWMPMVALVGSYLFCVHGGISPQVTSIRQVNHLHRPMPVYDGTVACDLVWSDPSNDTKDYVRSSRGNGVAFGKNALHEFLRNFKIAHVIRAHQCVPLGIEKFDGDSLITVFSCSNYADSQGNRCGLLFISQEGNIKTFSLPPIDQLRRENTEFFGAAGTGGIVSSAPMDGQDSVLRSSLLSLMPQPNRIGTIRKKSLSLGMSSTNLSRLPTLVHPKIPQRPSTTEPKSVGID